MPRHRKPTLADYRGQFTGLTDKDTAEFARIAIQLGLISMTGPIAWADAIIASLDTPPLWAIELSMAKPDEITECLKNIPGEPDRHLPYCLIIALLGRMLRLALIEQSEILHVAWLLATEDRLPPRERDWSIEFISERFDPEYVLHPADLGETLRPFGVFEDLIPNWAATRSLSRRT